MTVDEEVRTSAAYGRGETWAGGRAAVDGDEGGIGFVGFPLFLSPSPPFVMTNQYIPR